MDEAFQTISSGLGQGLHAFLASRSLRPTGSAYGELLLDELSVQDTGDYFRTVGGPGGG